MNRGFLRNRRHIIIAGILAVLILSSVWVTYTVLSFGMLHICVQEPDGPQIALSIPGAIVLAVLPFIPDGVWHDAADEIAPAGAIVRTALAELRRCPDFRMVHVQGRHEQVVVRKKGSSLLVEVEDGETSVRVKVPLKAAAYVVKHIERAGSV